MELKDVLTKVTKAAVYVAYAKEHPNGYLAHALQLTDAKKPSDWQIGYYDPKSKKVTVFVCGESVTKSPEDDPFRAEGHVEKLDLEVVSTSLDQAKEGALKYKQEIRPHETVTKEILLLQTVEGVVLWNLTLVTNAFSLINIRIDAATGKLVKSSVSSVLSLGKQD